MSRQNYIQSIQARELKPDSWQYLIQANERKISRLQRVKSLVVWFGITFLVSFLIWSLIIN